MIEIHFIKQGYEILTPVGPLGTQAIAEVARTCYRSSARGETERERAATNEALVGTLIKSGHEAMVEFSYLAVRFTCDRAIANEIVRHRHFSFAQESTRYVNYGRRGFEFVLPYDLDEVEKHEMARLCEHTAEAYENLARWTDPQTARAVLPLCTATRIVVAGNYREWRHFLRLRTAPDAHPQMRALVIPLLKDLRQAVPVVFDDIEIGGEGANG